MNDSLDVEFPSESFDRLNHFVSNLILLISSVLYMTLCYVAINFSPQEMKIYKFYILLNNLPILLISANMSFFQPKMLAPYPAVYIEGTLKYFGLNFSIVAFFASYLICFLLVCQYFLTILSFLYRYAQNTGHTYIINVVESRKVVALFIFLTFCTGVSVNVQPITMGFLFEKDVKELYRRDYPKVYEMVKNLSPISMKV